MPQVKLTPGFVRTATCPDGHRKIDFFDQDQPGLMLEIRSSGGKTFYQRYTDPRGRQRQFKIGSASVLTMAQVRQKARSILAQALLGADPQGEREQLRLIPSLAEFFREKYLPHVKSYKRSWRTDETVFRVHVLPFCRHVHLDSLEHQQVVSVLQRLRDRGYAPGTVNRVLLMMRHAFNLARKWKIPGAADNPTAGIATSPDVQRDRFLSRAETNTLMAAIDQDENRTGALAIKLLLFTGARRNEITQAKWEQVNLDKRTLFVPLSKSGKSRIVSLNSRAIDLLRSIPRVPGNPYIFPSPVTGRPSPSLHFPWNRIRKRAGLGDVRLHDLRHSFASHLVNAGVSLYVVQNLLGHLHSRTTQRYAHLAPDTLHEAAEVMAGVIEHPLSEQSSLGPDESQLAPTTDPPVD